MNISAQIKQKIDQKTKPLGSLGELESLALKIATIQNTTNPLLNRPVMLVFAADHGLCAEGISSFPKEVTFQMVLNFVNGGAAINVFCKQNNIELKVVDAGVDYQFPAELPIVHAKIARGTHNILKEPAMSVETCLKAVRKGRELCKIEFENGSNIIGFGEMGIGNSSSAALLMHKYTRIPIDECVGNGAGQNTEGINRKLEILRLCSNRYQLKDPLEILAAYGGFEIAMMCGSMLEAQKLGMTILIDGFIATSALLAAKSIDEGVLQNCVFCHQSDEKGHLLMLQHLNAKPLLNLGMRLGEGTGAALAFPLVKSAVAFLNEMASFDQAQVSNIN